MKVIKSFLEEKFARLALWQIILFGLVVSVISAYFVFANHIVTTYNGATNFNVKEDGGYLFNITINNTDLGSNLNITQVNITLPSGILFLAGITNGTSASGDFVNTSNVLTWSNFTYFLINGTNGSEVKNFWFNASAANPGVYNITIRTINSTSIMQTNISITVNDTTAPSSITFANPTPGNGTVWAGLPVNVSVIDNGNIGAITIKVYNSSSAEVANATTYSNSSLHTIFSGLSGTFFINATVNDTAGNSNKTITRTYVLTATSFEFNGTIRDVYGSGLNNSLVNVTITSFGASGPPTVIGYIASTSNASGWFNMTLPGNSAWNYKPAIRHTNSSTSAIDFVGQSLPDFPYAEFLSIGTTNFYLKEAGTINITAINTTGSRVTFNYQIKDSKLGYPIAYSFDTNPNEVIAYVPKDRNYSISIYPTNSMPVNYNWNNFSSINSYSLGLMSFNATTATLKKQFNTTMSLNRYTGYINKSGITGWDSFIIAPLLLEPGNMVFLEHGVMPYNMSSWSADGWTDFYNLTSGFYNITLPGSPETLNTLLFAIALNSSTYYGSFKNISLPFSPTSTQNNFTTNNVHGLLGDYSNLSVNDAANWGGKNISLKKQFFQLINSSGAHLTSSSHVEVTVDYSSYGANEITFMADTSQTSANFSIPLLNATGIKEMNIYSQMQAPKRLSKTMNQIILNNNITLTSFSPGDIDGELGNSQISIAIYTSNSTCDLPGNEASCALTSSATRESFNPLSAVISGGKISFRMGSGDILIHYVNVDLMASGPPDGMFNNESGASESADSFSNVMKFGSNGPTIYDYVLVSLPYREGSVSQTGLNESFDVNISIPTFYDQDSNGNMNWTAPIWSASNGTNGSALGGNYSHYTARQDEWGTLMGQNNCTRSTSEFNSTRPCYIDTVNNRTWIRLPHFSGTAPEMIGNIVTAVSSTTTTTSSGSSSGVSGFWTRTFADDKEDLSKLGTLNKELPEKQRTRILVNNETHYVGVSSFTTTRVVINVSSTPQSATLKEGEEKKFDLTSDGNYDLAVKINDILATKVNLTISYLSEKINAKEETKADSKKVSDTTIQQSPEVSSNNLIWVIVVIAVAVILGLGYFLWMRKRKTF